MADLRSVKARRYAVFGMYELLFPSHRSRPTVRTTPRPSTKPPMSEVKDERCGYSFHRGVTPSAAGTRTLKYDPVEFLVGYDEPDFNE